MKRPFRVLLVDDNESGRYALARCLRQQNYEVIETDSGAECLRLASQGGIGVILLDVKLPDINGFEVCKRLKENSRTAHIPVIQMSAHFTSGKDRAHGFDSGADGYLVAPFDQAELLAEVRAMQRIRESEVALRENEARLRMAKTAARLGIYEYRPETGEIISDERARELWGLGPEDRVDYNLFLSQLHPDDLAPTQAAVARAMDPAGKGEYYAEHRMMHGQRIVWVAATGQVTFAAGRAVQFVGTVQDITERKAFQEELERQVAERTRQLQETVQQLEQYSYSISHDMRAPLRAMNQYAQLLIEDFGANVGDDGRKYLERIRRAAQRLDRLVTDVLSYHRLTRSPMEPERVDVHTLTQDIIQQYPMLQDLHPDIHIDTPLLPVMANPAALTQCLSNLLGNAVKFVTPGVTPRVKIRTEKRDRFVRLWVEDNGIGVPPEHLEKIWGIFHQGPVGLNYEGTGVGLSIVKKAAERMAGQAGVESQPGQGSRFWIELPAADS